MDSTSLAILLFSLLDSSSQSSSVSSFQILFSSTVE
jgi:hypothetical protein